MMWRVITNCLLLPILSQAARTTEIGRSGGTACQHNSQCFSEVCFLDGYCAPDGPIRGRSAGGSVCVIDRNCFSNYCLNGICAPDSSIRSKVAGGGSCYRNEQCFCGACISGRCGPDSAIAGKMAAGGECKSYGQCFSGYCHSGRCAPDWTIEGLAPGGGYCERDNQCASGVCHRHSRCAPESLRYKWRTTDGGACFNDTHCEFGSRCLYEVCTPKEPKKRRQNEDPDVRPTPAPKAPAGSFCKVGSQCTNQICVNERCAPGGRFDPFSIADGAECDSMVQRGLCQSGHCIDGICTTSFFGQSRFAASAAGSPCEDNGLCYSGFCIWPKKANGKRKCSADSAADPIQIPGSPYRHRYQVAAGGACAENEDCYSGYCDNGICGADGPKRGTLASGAICQKNEHCYSNYCYKNRCMASAGGDNEGKVAPGGRCPGPDSCPLGWACVRFFCQLDPITHHLHLWKISRPILASVEADQPCWHNAQCKQGKCLERRCTLRRTVVPNYISAANYDEYKGYLLCLVILLGYLQ